MTDSAIATPEGISRTDDAARLDVVTIAAMAIVVYLLAAIIHEVLGHGLAALAVGAPIRHVTSLDLAAETGDLSAGQQRLVAAAGCLAQFVAAGVLGLLYRRLAASLSDNGRYFLWLLTLINVLIPAGYLTALSFAPFGDWNDFVADLPAPLLWRTALTLLGTAITVAAAFIGARALRPYLGSDKAPRARRALLLTLVPYLAGSAANTLAGVLNPDGALLVLTSAAAASFGGTIFLFWTGQFARSMAPSGGGKALTVRRSTGWYALGVVALLIYFLVLGPGIPR